MPHQCRLIARYHRPVPTNLRSLRRARRLAGALPALALLFIGCSRADDASPSPLPPRPPPTAHAPRVISLSVVASDFVLALGAEALLEGVDAESAALPGLDGVPVIDLDRARALTPDLLLIPGAGDGHEPPADWMQAADDGVYVVAPHDLQDVFDLCRDLGVRLVGAARAREFEIRVARDLSMIGGASFGHRRPRVAAVLGVAPLEIAGGHSFATDLIEIAGGDSVSHPGEDRRLAPSASELIALHPDLLLVVSARDSSDAERANVRERLPAEIPVAFLTLDLERFWVRDTAQIAERLRAIIEPLSRPLDPLGSD